MFQHFKQCCQVLVALRKIEQFAKDLDKKVCVFDTCFVQNCRTVDKNYRTKEMSRQPEPHAARNSFISTSNRASGLCEIRPSDPSLHFQLVVRATVLITCCAH